MPQGFAAFAASAERASTTFNCTRNNLFFTTFFLREYHYQKQRGNAFYHIQAINLPFQNFEFNYPAI